MKKRLLLILFAIILPFSFVYATGGGGESAGKSGYSLYFLPSNVANNQNIMVELSQAKAANPAELGLSYGDAVSNSYGEDNLVVFCLMDTLKETVQTSNVDFTITSPDAEGFFFKKDGNETCTVPFYVEVCCSVFYKGNNTTNYGTNLLRTKFSTVDPNYQSSKTINYTTHRTHINGWGRETDDDKAFTETTGLSGSGNTYTLSISPTGFYNTLNTSYWTAKDNDNSNYPNLIKFYYICLKILGGQNMEEGIYTARFNVAASFKAQEIGANTSKTTTISETIFVKGYVGEMPEMSDADYSFFLSPAVNTFFMDLAVEKGGDEPTYDVARVQFSNTQIVTNKNDPASTNQRQAFAVYISPTNIYTTSDDYEFIRTGTERQERVFANTVEFDLLLQTSDGVYEYIRDSQDYTGNGNNAKANAEAHFKKGKIGGAGLLNGTTNTFLLYPVYSSQQTSSGANNKWKETWELDQHIYLRVKEDSKEISEGANARKHQEGMYKTTIYFTVVSP